MQPSNLPPNFDWLETGVDDRDEEVVDSIEDSVDRAITKEATKQHYGNASYREYWHLNKKSA